MARAEQIITGRLDGADLHGCVFFPGQLGDVGLQLSDVSQYRADPRRMHLTRPGSTIRAYCFSETAVP